MKRTLFPVLFLFFLLIPGFAGLVNFTAPSQKELGQVFIFSAKVTDGGGAPTNNTPCQTYVTANNGEIVNYFKPDLNTNTLYTDNAGNLVYGFKLIDNIYQVNNIYNVTVLCPSGSVTQTFETLPAKTPNQAFNWPLFLSANAAYVVVLLLLLFVIKLVLDKSVGAQYANLIAAIVLLLLVLATLYVWVFR